MREEISFRFHVVARRGLVAQFYAKVSTYNDFSAGNPVLIDGGETIHRPCDVVVITVIAQRCTRNIGRVRPT